MPVFLLDHSDGSVSISYRQSGQPTGSITEFEACLATAVVLCEYEAINLENERPRSTGAHQEP